MKLLQVGDYTINFDQVMFIREINNPEEDKKIQLYFVGESFLELDGKDASKVIEWINPTASKPDKKTSKNTTEVKETQQNIL